MKFSALPTLAVPLMVFLMVALARPVAANPAEGLSLEDLRAFTDAWRHVKEHYVEAVDDRQLLEAAMKGMLSNLDPHSKWLNAEEFTDLEQQAVGRYGGLGLQIGVFENYLKVVSVYSDGPAEEAGVQPGDRIVGIDSQSLDASNVGDAAARIRGLPGSQVDIRIERDGLVDTLEFKLTRRIIERSSVRAERLAERYLHLKIDRFQQNTATELDRLLSEFESADPVPSGLILDLRDNPGGMLQAAIAASDRFLSEKLVVSAAGRNDEQSVEYRTGPGEHFPDLPMVVLVDRGSASAAEIMAGALRDHGRAMIIGEPTYGKGSVQTIWPLSNGTGIRLTTALYFTPGGHRIQARGITPDVLSSSHYQVETEADSRGRENDRPGHIPGDADTDDWTSPLESTDPMLADALRLLISMERMNRPAVRQDAAR